MKKILFFIIPLLVLVSCRKDMDIIDVVDPPTDEPVVLIQATIEGTVHDENGEPLADLIVKLNEFTAKTRFDGRFTFLDVNIDNSKQTISIEHQGYFRASRSFTALAGNQTELLVKMIKRNQIGDFNGSETKMIEGDEGYQISFPANSVKDSNGELFSGKVNVYAKWMDPTAEETFQEMPGDLTGVTIDGEETGLITYGMMNIELESESGESLNVADGSEVELRFPVPDAIINNAPSIIPLWYFDEGVKRWIEEGSADLIGNEYIGKVSHFTVWNCDDPIDVIDISGLINLTNERESNVKIKITSLETNFEFFACSSTNGSFVIPAAENEELLVEIYEVCGPLIYSEVVGPFAEDTTLDPITSESVSTTSYLTVSGTILDCAGNLAEGISVHLLSQTETTIIGNDITDVNGYYEITSVVCNNGNMNIEAVNVNDKFSTSSEQFQFSGSDKVLQPLEMCQEYTNSMFTEILFDDQMFIENSALFNTYEVVEIPVTGDSIKYLFTITILDWLSAAIYEQTFLYRNYETVHLQQLDFSPFGFEVTGNAIIDYNTEPGDTSLCIQFLSTDLTVTDPTVYTGTQQVEYNIINQ